MSIERTNGKCFASIEGERVEITRRLANKTQRLGLSEQQVAERHAMNQRRLAGKTRRPW
jgi:hypothetical protein